MKFSRANELDAEPLSSECHGWGGQEGFSVKGTYYQAWGLQFNPQNPRGGRN